MTARGRHAYFGGELYGQATRGAAEKHFYLRQIKIFTSP